MKRILALLFAVMLVVLPACGGGTETTAPETSGDQTVTDTGTEAETEAHAPIPDNLNFDGADFIIYCTGNLEWHDFDIDESDTTVLGEAIYRRNALTEETLGVTIIEDADYLWGDSYGNGTGFNRLYNSYQSESPVCDIAMIGTHDVANLAVTGAIRDLSNMQYLNLDQPYWNQKANESFRIGGKLPFTIGAFSTIVDSYTFCILFNKKLADEYDLPNLYEIVENKQWTIDKFSEFVRATYEDLNGNDTVDKADRFGAIVWNDTFRGAINAAGESVGVINDKGKLELTFYNDRINDIVTRYTEIAYSENCFNYQSVATGTWSATLNSMFMEDRALFDLTAVNNTKSFRDTETDYGILPYFMLNEDQGEYYSMVQEGGTQFFCVPLHVEDIEKTSYVTEYMAAESYNIIRPAFYEKTLVGKTIRDDESKTTLDIVLNSQNFDMGAYYQIGSYTTDSFRFFLSKSTNFSSFYLEREAVAKSDVDRINKAIAELE